AFTPIPYKVFTIAAGLFGISIPTFIIASILGRGGRFFAVATVMRYFGEHITRVFYRYFNILSIVFVGIVGVGIYIFIAR
ncbi:MAG: DedA family protein, partial [Minisyncoccia bacterium]